MVDNTATMAAYAANQLSGYQKSQADRAPYGYEEAGKRLYDNRARFDEQIDRLLNILGPILDVGPPPDAGVNGSRPGYSSALLQELHNHADNFGAVSDRLESLIQRIRL